MRNCHSQTQGNNTYNMKFIQIQLKQNLDLKVQSFLFSKTKWAIERGQLLVTWLISAVYVTGSYEKHFKQNCNQRIMHKTHRDHIIWRLHTLIGFLHQKSMSVVEGTFHCTEVINLREWKFYKKVVAESQHQNIWGYDLITTKNYLWMVEHGAGVTYRPTKKSI